MARCFFIAGTDTGVGKTYIAAKLLGSLCARGGSCAYIKPFQTGCRLAGDRLASPDVGEVKGMLGPLVECHVLQLFELPACPMLAAKEVGLSIDFQSAVEWTRKTAEKYENAVIEGAGGLLVPLTESETMLDFAAELGYPVVLVASNRLGCMNHALLSIRALEERGLAIETVVLNDLVPGEGDPVRDANAGMIEMFAPSVRIFRVTHGGELVL